MDKSKYGIHQGHCCVKHGCKYNEPNCPVVSGEVKQKYTCEECDDDGIKSLSDLMSKEDVEQVKTIFEEYDDSTGADNTQLLNKLLNLIKKEYPYMNR